MATYTEFINELSAKTGLHVDVITAWVNLEKGVNNNILGIRSSAGPLMTFPSQKAAADATAAILQNKSSSLYAGIRASESGTSAQQALAIAKSPWHLGPGGLAQAGGVDPYYLSGFIRAGLLAGSPTFTPPSPTPSGGASTPITPSPGAISDELTKLQQEFGALGLNTDPNHPITYDEALKFANGVEHIYGDIANSFALAMKGKTLTDIAKQDVAGQTTSVNAISDLQNSLPNIDVPAALTFVAIILVGIAFLFLGGFVILKAPKGASA